MHPEVRRAKVDGVAANLRQAREEYYRKAAKCAEKLTALQAGCTHTIVHEEGRPRGTVIKCTVCDWVLGGGNN